MIKTLRLPNGVTCVSEERPQSGKVSMHVFIKSGSADEAAEETLKQLYYRYQQSKQ